MSLNLNRLMILLVDDNRFYLQLITDMLRSMGIRNVVAHSNPITAYGELCHLTPDIIITDFEMSPVGGVDFVRMVRTGQKTPDPFVPVIMMSSYATPISVEMARDSGIDEFLSKPVSLKDLALRVHEVLQRPRQFVVAKGYFGPDRRRRPGEMNLDDRRCEEPKPCALDEFPTSSKEALMCLPCPRNSVPRRDDGADSNTSPEPPNFL